MRPRAALKRDTGDKTELSSKPAYLTVIYRNLWSASYALNFNHLLFIAVLYSCLVKKRFILTFSDYSQILMQFLNSSMVSILSKFLADKKSSCKVKNIRISSSCLYFLTMKFINKKTKRKHPWRLILIIPRRSHPEYKYLLFPEKELALVNSFYGL